MQDPADEGLLAAGPVLDRTVVGAGVLSRVQRVAAPVREQVADILRQAIVEMRFRPGQRLVERELIELVGVSRTTIREALRQLAAEGLVTTIPQKGAIVAVPSAQEAAEVYEVRALLEGLAAKQFAERASDDQVQALRRRFDNIEASASAREPSVLLAAKNEFYRVLFEGAANATVKSLLEGLQARVTVLRATSLTSPGRPKQAVEEIRAIVEAIEARDAEAAGAECSHHVRRAAEAASARLQTIGATFWGEDV
jgi:GntR family transcriptional regulator, trigonelline degradation regulator